MKIEEAVSKYYELKQQHAAIEAEMKKCKEKIEKHTKVGDRVSIGDYSVLLSSVTRENFKLSDARETLATAQFQAWVAPFITTTEYNQLRVTAERKAA